MSSDSSPTEVLERALVGFRGELTVADAAAKSGLPLRDAEAALRALAADRSGHLAATDKGELIYSFPGGLVRAPETRWLRRAGRSLVKFGAGAIRLVVRAWVSVVLVGYALAFVAILIALALRGGDDRDDRSPMAGVGAVFRMVAEALFWTFHPFSPVSFGREPGWLHEPARRARLPFYERVNRFVFGPTPAKVDPREAERRVLAEIRRYKGRIAPADVMRVTGASRAEAEHLLLRLVVDYAGDLKVTDSGAILYSFPELRSTVAQQEGDGGGRRASPAAAAPPAWLRRAELPPLTGNSAESNLLFGAINGFNLLASGYVIAHDFTLERLAALFTQLGSREPLPLPPGDGAPLVLGWVPFAFSLALFAFPLVRALRRPAEARQVARENGWRGALRLVLGQLPAQPRTEYTREELARAWAAAGGGENPSDADLEKAVRDLGGEVELGADGIIVYRFEGLTEEVKALLEERARAEDSEAFAGEVIFSSADEGSGIRASAPVAPPPRAEATAPGKDKSRDQDEHPVPRLEEHREPIEFLDRVMAEAKRRRRE